MAKVETKNKQNPKLVQTVLKDGRASLALEYYLGRSETPVLDDDGNPILYTEGAMAGRPKYKSSITANEKILIYTSGYILARNRRGHRTATLFPSLKKSDSSGNRSFWRTEKDTVSKRRKRWICSAISASTGMMRFIPVRFG